MNDRAASLAKTLGIDIFPWDINFSTGLPKIDEQHRKLVELLNQLASHVALRSNTVQIGKVFDELADYAVYHFDAEEALWGAYLAGDVLEVQHKQTHRTFIETVQRLRSEQSSRSLDEVAEEALGFLARWLASHILETDRYMAYTVQALQEGLSIEDAWKKADSKMSGANRVLVNIILSIYETLSSNTLQLMREIAERKRKENDLTQARLHAEAANVAKSEFLRNMSHEFRTPLNGIMGMAQLLQQNDLSESDRKKFSATLLESGQKLTALMDNLLSLSSVETGVLSLEVGLFEPRALMREIQERFTDTITNKGLRLETSIEEWVAPQYQGDGQRLRQMLDNLLSNAIKFTEHGHIRVSIREIERSAQNALLEFLVSDTGIGLEAPRYASLFQPFSQLDGTTTRSYSGTGIGLSIVRNLAELMGGTVGVDSKPEAGSTFWFRVNAPLASN